MPEDYLPEQLVGTTIYEPGDSGFEKELADRLDALRARKRTT